jgi:O-acetylserine/cysteine efflux transporter
MDKSTDLAATDLAAALGVVVIWGLNFVAMKYALHDFTLPAGLLALRFRGVPAAAVRAQAQAQLGLAGRGGLTQLGQFTFLFLALHVGMTAALASVLMQTQVFFTTLLGLMFLRERLTAPMVAGLGLASAGLACFALGFLDGGAPHGGAVTGLGLLLNLLAAAMWALSNIVARRAQMAQPGFDAVQYVVWMSLVPLAPFAALAWWAEPESHPLAVAACLGGRLGQRGLPGLAGHGGGLRRLDLAAQAPPGRAHRPLQPGRARHRPGGRHAADGRNHHPLAVAGQRLRGAGVGRRRGAARPAGRPAPAPGLRACRPGRDHLANSRVMSEKP